MNEKQKIFAVVGIASVTAFIVIGYGTHDWIQEYNWLYDDGSYKSVIAWHSFFPFIITVGSAAASHGVRRRKKH